jgi:hypothetical protein
MEIGTPVTGTSAFSKGSESSRSKVGKKEGSLLKVIGKQKVELNLLRTPSAEINRKTWKFQISNYK